MDLATVLNKAAELAQQDGGQKYRESGFDPQQEYADYFKNPQGFVEGLDAWHGTARQIGQTAQPGAPNPRAALQQNLNGFTPKPEGDNGGYTFSQALGVMTRRMTEAGQSPMDIAKEMANAAKTLEEIAHKRADTRIKEQELSFLPKKQEMDLAKDQSYIDYHQAAARNQSEDNKRRDREQNVKAPGSEWWYRAQQASSARLRAVEGSSGKLNPTDYIPQYIKERQDAAGNLKSVASNVNNQVTRSPSAKDKYGAYLNGVSASMPHFEQLVASAAGFAQVGDIENAKSTLRGAKQGLGMVVDYYAEAWKHAPDKATQQSLIDQTVATLDQLPAAFGEKLGEQYRNELLDQFTIKLQGYASKAKTSGSLLKPWDPKTSYDPVSWVKARRQNYELSKKQRR